MQPVQISKCMYLLLNVMQEEYEMKSNKNEKSHQFCYRPDEDKKYVSADD